MIPPIGVRVPTFNWHQTDATLTVSIYTRRPEISPENVIVQVRETSLLQILVLIHEDRREEFVFQIAFKLFDKVSTELSPKIGVGTTSGKVEVVFEKAGGSEPRWTCLGDPLPGELKNQPKGLVHMNT